MPIRIPRTFDPPKSWTRPPGNSLIKWIARAGFACSMAALFSHPGLASQWPPVFESWWVVTSTLSLLAIVLALSSSRVARGGILSGASIVIALLAFLLPVISYEGSYRDFPWPAIGVVVGVTIVGGFVCSQRILAMGCLALMIYVFGSAMLPATGEGRRVLKSGDVTLTFDEDSEYPLSLEGPPEKDLSQTYDLENVRITGMSGAVIPVACGPLVKRGDFFDDKTKMNVAQYSAKWFIPSVARHWSAQVIVPTWPAQSKAHVDIALTPEGIPRHGSVYSASSGAWSISVSHVHWGDTTNQWPVKKCLRMSVDYRNPDYCGWEWDELRILDGKGQLLRYTTGEVNGSLVQIEIEDLQKLPNAIRVECYSSAQRAAYRVVFNLPSLPVRRSYVVQPVPAASAAENTTG